MEIELRHLRYFMAVADHGGMRRAADALGVLHGTLSHRLRDLEEEVGVALFFRSNKGVKLTKAGQDFLRRIRRVFNEMQEAFDQVYAEGDVETGEVSIGLFSSLASGFLPELLSEYKHENPSIRLRYSQGSALSHIGEIRSNSMDVAFLAGYQDIFGCRVEPLWTEAVYAALPENHPLAQSDQTDSITWQDLVGSHFLVSELAAGREMHDYIADQMKPYDQHPVIEHCDLHHDNLLPLVGLGKGIAIAGEAFTSIAFPGVVYRRIADASVEFSMVWSPANENPALRRFLFKARAIAKDREHGQAASR